MERNIGQALGLGALAVPDTGQSTVLPRNLHRLELLAKKIDPPAWPMAWFKLPPIDKARASEGKKLSATHCASGHDKPGGEVVPLAKVGTAPQRAENFARRMSDGKTFADAVPTLDDLLKPAAQRPRIFPVGHREYDFDRLGYV